MERCAVFRKRKEFYGFRSPRWFGTLILLNSRHLLSSFSDHYEHQKGQESTDRLFRWVRSRKKRCCACTTRNVCVRYFSIFGGGEGEREGNAKKLRLSFEERKGCAIAMRSGYLPIDGIPACLCPETVGKISLSLKFSSCSII